MPRCPNEVKIGNIVDQLRITGGFWKEQRRRHLHCVLLHSTKLKQEIEHMGNTTLEENAQIGEDTRNEDAKMKLISMTTPFYFASCLCQLGRAPHYNLDCF